MLTTLVDKPPAGDDWVHEIKYDGYRMVVRIERGRARLYSRNGKEWTSTFPAVAKDLAALPVKSAWIDGEVVVLDADGRTSFQALQNALASTSAQRPRLLRVRPHVPRRLRPARRGADRAQARAARPHRQGRRAACAPVPNVQGNGADFFAQACSLGLEGIIAKRADVDVRAASGRGNG